MKLNKTALIIGASVLAMAAASAASAQEIKTAVSVGGFSDYRLRGVSLSDEEPVIQGSIEGEVAFNDSFSAFGGVWASSLDTEGGFGALETDFYVGAKGKISELTWKATYLRLYYHDARGLDFDQYAFEVGHPIGPFSGAAGVVRDEYDPGNSTYIWGSLGYAFADTPFSVKALVGHEDGAYGFDDKVNWGLGASYAFQKLSFNLEYIDTNKEVFGPTGKDLAGSTLLVSVTSAF